MSSFKTTAYDCVPPMPQVDGVDANDYTLKQMFGTPIIRQMMKPVAFFSFL